MTLNVKLKKLKSYDKENSAFSTVFNNQDGNFSNFDSLIVHLEQYNNKNSILAETYTNEDSKSLF